MYCERESNPSRSSLRCLLVLTRFPRFDLSFPDIELARDISSPSNDVVSTELGLYMLFMCNLPFDSLALSSLPKILSLACL